MLCLSFEGCFCSCGPRALSWAPRDTYVGAYIVVLWFFSLLKAGEASAQPPTHVFSTDSSSESDAMPSPSHNNDGVSSASFLGNPTYYVDGHEVVPASLGREVQFHASKHGCYGEIQGV